LKARIHHALCSLAVWRGSLLLVGICGITATLSGCVPSYETYYVPSATGGIVRGYGIVGGKHIFIEKDGIKANIVSGTSLPADLTSNLSLSIYITSNPSSRLKACFADFAIYTTGSKQPLLPTRIVQSRYYTTPHSTDVEIRDCVSIPGQNYFSYELIYKIRYSEWKQFTLKPFSVERNNVPVQFPQIDFTLKSGWEILPING
jgi:hypothetical protein